MVFHLVYLHKMANVNLSTEECSLLSMSVPIITYIPGTQYHFKLAFFPLTDFCLIVTLLVDNITHAHFFNSPFLLTIVPNSTDSILITMSMLQQFRSKISSNLVDHCERQLKIIMELNMKIF